MQYRLIPRYVLYHSVQQRLHREKPITMYLDIQLINSLIVVWTQYQDDYQVHQAIRSRGFWTMC